MDTKHVLVVDDEKNIRLTLAEALRDMDLVVDTAGDGDAALAKLERGDYGLLLLDLRMPGLDGMELLRRVREMRPEVRMIVITAHGTIASAVEAMKLGAVDFIQKPFTPAQIRALVGQVQAREALDPEQAADYVAFIELARRGITQQQFGLARDYVRRALAQDDAQPEAHNLLGVLHEIDGRRFEAQQRYRKALALDPTYAPARANLHQSVEPGPEGSFLLDEAKKASGKAK